MILISEKIKGYNNRQIDKVDDCFIGRWRSDGYNNGECSCNE